MVVIIGIIIISHCFKITTLWLTYLSPCCGIQSASINNILNFNLNKILRWVWWTYKASRGILKRIKLHISRLIQMQRLILKYFFCLNRFLLSYWVVIKEQISIFKFSRLFSNTIIFLLSKYFYKLICNWAWYSECRLRCIFVLLL